MGSSEGTTARYDAIILEIFQRHYKEGIESFEFKRDELEEIAQKLQIKLPKNLGDLIYSFRFRKELPEAIYCLAPKNYEWIIELAGHAKYRFRLARVNRIVPNTSLAEIKVPESTPEIIAKYAKTDEQALLAKVHYNRLIDIFLGITAYSLQSHMRTTVPGIGQIEIDEVYVGLNKHGAHFIVPVQAKGGSDQLGGVQATQDIACCKAKFPEAVCRPVAAQFVTSDLIAMFELTLQKDQVKIVEEKHYRLMPFEGITQSDLKKYRTMD